MVNVIAIRLVEKQFATATHLQDSVKITVYAVIYTLIGVWAKPNGYSFLKRECNRLYILCILELKTLDRQGYNKVKQVFSLKMNSAIYNPKKG